ncbi:MAG: hypothetical protein ABH825_00170 [Candidatus Omnitrophota bacterium]
MDLNKLIKDPIFFKIVKFFSENPASIDTPRGIATWIGEDKPVTKNMLDKLVDLKILTAHKVSSTTGYSYTDDRELIRKIDSTLKKMEKSRA